MVEMGAEKEAIKAATQRKKLAKEQAEKWPAAQVEAAKVGVSMAGWRALMVLIVGIFMGMSMTVVASSVLSSSPPMHASTASSTASGSETMCAKDASNPMKVITLPAISWTNLINDLTPSDAARTPYEIRCGSAWLADITVTAMGASNASESSSMCAIIAPLLILEVLCRGKHRGPARERAPLRYSAMFYIAGTACKRRQPAGRPRSPGFAAATTTGASLRPRIERFRSVLPRKVTPLHA